MKYPVPIQPLLRMFILCGLLAACGEKNTYLGKSEADKETPEIAREEKDADSEAAEISDVLGMRLGNWSVFSKEDNELVEEYVGSWKERGKSIQIRGVGADGGFYSQVVIHDPKTGVYVETLQFENGDEVVRHGRWDKESETLRIEVISMNPPPDPPLADGVKAELALKAAGPNEMRGTYSERGGESEYQEEFVARRTEKEPAWLLEGKIIGTVGFEFVGEKFVDEARLRSIIRAASGTIYDREVIDSDIRSLYESGHIEDVRGLAEKVDGKVRLVYEVMTRPTESIERNPDLSD